MAGGFIIAAALGAGYLATRAKPAATGGISGTDPEHQAMRNGAEALAATANPGDYVAPTGAAAESSYGGVKFELTEDTSKTPSGDTTGGNTSTTPAAGGISPAVLGTQLTLDDSSSPSGPAAHVLSIPVDRVRYGFTGGLTNRQLSNALTTEGPQLGLVW